MTPSSRNHISSQMRRIRDEESRSTVDHAFYALQALTNDQLIALAERHNALWRDRSFTPHIVLAATEVKP